MSSLLINGSAPTALQLAAIRADLGLGSGTPGAANGVALLDSNADLPAVQMPNNVGPLGPYTTLALLEAAWPSASNPGKTAYIGATAPYTEYVSNGVTGVTGWKALVTAYTDPLTGMVTGLVGPDGVVDTKAYRMIGNAPARNRIILIGDSKTSQNGGVSVATPVQAISNIYDSKGPFNHANVLLNHAFDVVGNAGIGGQKSAQIGARFITDVLAYASEWVFGMAGTNDTSISDDTLNNIVAMWDKATSAGRRVLWATIPPQTSASDAVNQYHMQVNRGLKIAASRRPNVVLASHEAATLDTATTFKALASMLTDGTHESALGAAYEGRIIADAVRPYVSTANPWLAQSNVDLDNLLTNPLLLGSGSATPTGWGKIGASTISYVASTDGVQAPWCQTAVTNGTVGGQGLTGNASVGASLAIGDRCIGVLEFAGNTYDAAAAANTQGLFLKLQAYNGSSFFASTADLYWDTTYANFTMQGNGVLQTPEFVVPATTTILQIYVGFYGGGNFPVRRAAIRNLTKLGY